MFTFFYSWGLLVLFLRYFIQDKHYGPRFQTLLDNNDYLLIIQILQIANVSLVMQK